MDLQLEGKAALVTGSSKGIGAAIAKALAREGATVIVHGRDMDQADRIVTEISSDNGRATAVVGDLTSNDDVDRILAEVQRRHGAVDVVVNNAGGSGPRSDWTSIDADQWLASYDRNVIAAIRITGGLIPGMRMRGWGRVINISSGAATMPPATGGDYSAAKAAINAMTASMAKALAKDGITVNAVSPGTIRSAKLEEGFRSAADARGLAARDAPWSEIEQAVLPLFADVPMGRVGTVDDVANAVAFLASPLASYVTGVNMHIDGGFSSLA
jgi:3-oxoacyl-[acyl-carrier protein] reductase